MPLTSGPVTPKLTTPEDATVLTRNTPVVPTTTRSPGEGSFVGTTQKLNGSNDRRAAVTRTAASGAEDSSRSTFFLKGINSGSAMRPDNLSRVPRAAQPMPRPVISARSVSPKQMNAAPANQTQAGNGLATVLHLAPSRAIQCAEPSTTSGPNP